MPKRSLRQAIKYSLAGLVSTVVDYGVLNLLMIVFHFALIPANLISTTIGGVVSYLLDKKVVFEGRKRSRPVSILLFTVINATAIYGVQSLVLWLVTPQLRFLGSEVVGSNVAKIAATILGGIWAFLLLRRFVFARHTAESHE